MDRKKIPWAQIFIPVGIIAIIVVLGLMKNAHSQPDVPAITEPTGTVADHLAGADFSLNATSQIDFAELSKYGLPIIVDYGADSCIPCKQMAPVLVKLNAEMQGKAFIKFVDVWEYYEAAGNVPVQMIPTQFFFDADGKPFVPSDKLSAEIGFKMEYDKAGNHVYTTHVGGVTEAQMRAILKEMGVE